MLTPICRLLANKNIDIVVITEAQQLCGCGADNTRDIPAQRPRQFQHNSCRNGTFLSGIQNYHY